MADIVFIKDFAEKKKGTKWANCPNGIAKHLLSKKVAKYAKEAKSIKSK